MFEDAIAAVAETAPQIAQALPLVPGLQLNVDGDYMAYYCAGNNDTSVDEARQNCIDRLNQAVARTGASSIVMHNTSNGCQKGERYLIATVKKYQSNRTSESKPKNYRYLQNWLQSYEGPLFRPKNWGTREADDGIGACAMYATGRSPGYAVIMTRDKDMRMLPGLHLNWMTWQATRVLPGAYDVRGEDGLQYGLKFFWQQMLMGDYADAIPGLEQMRSTNAKGKLCFKKVGEATAIDLIDYCETNEQACLQVMDLYRFGYAESDTHWADRFVEQAALLWMRLSNDAAVADFAHHTGHSRINHQFSSEVWDAVERLETRVKIARAEINSFADNDDPLATDSGSGR